MAFDDRMIEAIWKKGALVTGNDPDVWRQDLCGAWMWRAQYGNRDSQYGWEVDHIIGIDYGGSDAFSNLRPLQWQNNAPRGPRRLKCSVTAKGKDNASA